MKKLLPFMFAFVSCSTIAEPLTSSTKYVVREIGSSVYIEPVPNIGPKGIAGATLGTGIAAGLQSQPIRLKKNTDYACKYQNLTNRKLEGCSDLSE